MTLQKTAIADMFAERMDIDQRAATQIINALLDIVTEGLATGEKVTLTGFGTFELRPTASRVGVKPGTHERIQIPAGHRISFKPGTKLRQELKIDRPQHQE